MKIQAYADTSGAAPAWATYFAIDTDTYDGESSECQLIGYGCTEVEAVKDLLMQFEDRDRIGDD